jgi:phospholipase/carboxylesterase
MKLRPTLGKPIVTGFSQGGILSFALATRYPTLFAAAFPLAGWLPPVLYPPAATKQKYPYIYAQHGARDTTVPTQKGRATIQGLRARGLRVDYREVPGVGHLVTSGMHSELHTATNRFLAGYFDEKKKR